MLLQACCCCAPCARHACFGGRTAAPGEGGGPAPEAREDVCAVCLDAATHPCLTSCNHQFCTGCLHQYWQAQFAPAAVKCPMCRQEVVALVPVGDTEADAAAAEQVAQYNAQVGAVQNIRLGQWQNLGPLLQAAPGILAAAFTRRHGWLQLLRLAVTSQQLWRLAGAFLYTVLPVDLMPEALLGPFGLLDDVFTWLLWFAGLALAYQHLLVQQAQRGGGA